MSRRYKGIEPIIAVVILVAVTLVIAIGVIGWIMGWWGTFGATESIRVYPDSYIDSDGELLYLHIKNEGSAAAVIYKVEVSGLGEGSSPDVKTSTPTNSITASGNEVTVQPGAEGTIAYTLTSGGVPGTRYQVTIYTKAGNVISATVQAK